MLFCSSLKSTLLSPEVLCGLQRWISVYFFIPNYLFCGASRFTITAETRRSLYDISSLFVDLLEGKHSIFLILETLALTLNFLWTLIQIWIVVLFIFLVSVITCVLLACQTNVSHWKWLLLCSFIKVVRRACPVLAKEKSGRNSDLMV